MKSYKSANKIGLYVLSIIIGFIFLAPFYIILVNSFKSKKEIFMNTLALPQSLSFQNYLEAFERLNFFQVLANSLMITIISIIFIIIFASMAGWMLQRTKSKLSGFIFLIFVSSMLVPFQSVMLPLVRLMGNFNMLNIPGLIFMYLGFGSSMAIFLYHGFVKSISTSLDEAAKIDGCSTWQIFWKIIFPILKPISITVAILNAVWIWNDYLLPSLTVNKPDTHTIPLRIYYFFGEYTKQWHLAMAGLTLAIIPVIVFYFFAQKHIIKSVTAGSVKG